MPQELPDILPGQRVVFNDKDFFWHGVVWYVIGLVFRYNGKMPLNQTAPKS
jgi:hypothetical protein